MEFTVGYFGFRVRFRGFGLVLKPRALKQGLGGLPRFPLCLVWGPLGPRVQAARFCSDGAERRALVVEDHII